MSRFTARTIVRIETLGDKLRRLRGEAHLSLDVFAQSTGVQPKYLLALEAGRYDELPGDVYARNFLRLYADQLHVSYERIMQLYEQERAVVRASLHVPTLPRVLPESRAVNVPRLLRRLSVAAGILVLLTYFGFKIQRVIAPPALTITSPTRDLVTHEPSVQVEGVTEGETVVRINGQEVYTDSAGRFAERIDLQPGLNIIQVAAAKQRSRAQVVYRRVMLTPEDPEDGQSSLKNSYYAQAKN